MIRRGRFTPGLMVMAVTLAGAPAVGIAPLSAQPPGPQRSQMERAQLERRVLAQFSQIVQDELGLDSAATAGLFAVVEEFGDQRRALQMREMGLNRRLRSTGVYLSDEESSAALREFIAIKREELTLLEAEQARLAEELSPPQLLRFYALREQMGERIRRLRGEGPRGDAPGRDSSNDPFPESPQS